MKPSKAKIRSKIKTNGFTRKELLSFKKEYDDVKSTFHPNLTKDFSLQDVIYKQAKGSLSPLQIFFPMAIFFLIPPFISNNKGYFFMTVFFLLFGLWDFFSTAKSNGLTIINQLKLMKLAIRVMF